MVVGIGVGGVAVWLYQDGLIDEVQYIVHHADARILVGEGQEEVDKALAIREKCPVLERVLWADPKGMRAYDDPLLLSLEAVRDRGRDLLARVFERPANAGSRLDPASTPGEWDQPCQWPGIKAHPA